jgi:caffeoyl-CoA O-methyltransferase
MLSKKLIEYAEYYTKPESKLLHKLNRETNLKVLRARMLSGHMQGRILQMVSQMIKPKQVLEIGTFTGYSAICLASGLQKGGKLHTIDINPELEDMILKYFNEAKLLNKIKLYIGEAMKIIPKIDNVFELVFIDADKENYVNYFELVFSKVRKGGFILADNALWDGKVLDPPKAGDIETKGIIDFNKHILKDKRVENILLPHRDGLQIIRKL